MEKIFQNILITSLYASIVGIILIIIKTFLRNKLSPKWHYILWCILIIKLIVPFGPESKVSLFNKVPSIQTSVNTTNSSISNKNMSSVKTNSSINRENLYKQEQINSVKISEDTNNTPKSIIFYLQYIWIFGIIITLLWLLYANYSLYFKLKNYEESADRRIDEILEKVKGIMGVKRDIQIIFQPIIYTPSLFGLFKPKILLHPSILNLNDREISYILFHELAHYKRKDIFVNYVLLIFQILHWFNPVIWYCFRRIRQDMEAAADERVLNVLEENEHREYGKALLSILESYSSSKFVPKLIGIVDDKKNMERRIRMIKMSDLFKRKANIIFVIGMLCIIFMSAILLTSGKTSGDIYTKEKTVDNINCSELYKYKTPYVGDNTKVLNIIGNLQYSSLSKGVSLQTNKKPYGITVNYDFSNENENIKIVEDNLKTNSIIMFTLIDNVDIVNFVIKGMDTNESYQFTREEIQKAYNKDIREYGKDIKQFKILFNSLSFKVIVMPEKYALSMSNTPGIKIQPVFAGQVETVRYYTSTGKLIGWDRNNGNIKVYGDKAALPYDIPAYWSPIDEDGLGKEKAEAVVKIQLYDKSEKLIAEKDINIKLQNGFYSPVSEEGIIIGNKVESPEEYAKTIEEAVSFAVKGQASSYRDGEVATEGHIILATEEKNGIITVYTVCSNSNFGFENGIFTSISGSGAIPTVISFRKNQNNRYILLEYKEPMDGSYYISSIKEMFPKKLWNKVLNTNDYPEIRKQQEEQAEKYLQSIGRKAKVSAAHIEKELADINVQASNKLFSEYTKYNQELNKFPYWLGSLERIEGGIRYIYETSQSKTSDGYNLIIFTMKKENGTIVNEYKYKIIGSEPKLIK